jgi:pilus assembly protein Flp/PilA
MRTGSVVNPIFKSQGVTGMKKLIARFVREDEGQDLIEYAFLAVFIALAVVAGLTIVGTQINSQMSNIGTQVGS